jgi:hypothetical protein
MKKQNSDKKDLDSKVKWIKATIILEIMGKPPEHLVKTLEEIIKNIGEEKGVSVSSKKINEPAPMKDSKEFYTTFAEVDLEVEDILYLTIIMFKYMPAHIEVLEPELIALTNNGWSDILSELTRRLHGYEEIARILKLQNMKMQKKMQELMTNKTEDNEISPSIVVSPKEVKEEEKKGKEKKKK